MFNLTATLLILCALPCLRSFNATNKNAAREIPPDTSLNYVILPYDTADHHLFPRAYGPTYRPAELSIEKIDTCSRLMTARIEEYNKTHQSDTINLKDYYFQYIAGLSSKGAEMVFINALCRSAADNMARTERDLNWKERRISTEDGGKCFFYLMVDLDHMRVIRLSVNSLR